MAPTVLQALARGADALRRCAWVGAVGLLVSLVRAVLLLPAQLFAFVILQLAAASWIARHGGLPVPGVAAHGVLIALGSPRFVAIAAGLWSVAVLLALALRAAYLAGALPTLGAALAGEPPARRFAGGFARGFAALLPTAVAAFVLELLAFAVLASFAVAAVLSGSALLSRSLAGPLAIAAAGAAALLLQSAVSALNDAALCRAALRGERAGRAFGRAAIRFGARPGAFLAVSIAAAVAGIVLGGSADALGALGARAAAAQVSPWLAAGPQLMAATLAALLGALVDLWRLASTAVLACHSAQQP